MTTRRIRRQSTLETGPKSDEENTQFWSEQVAIAARKTSQEMQHALASLLMGLGCADEAAPYVAGGLSRNGRVAATGPYAKVIEHNSQSRNLSGCRWIE